MLKIFRVGEWGFGEGIGSGVQSASPQGVEGR
jgi:hypothetical protein